MFPYIGQWWHDQPTLPERKWSWHCSCTTCPLTVTWCARLLCCMWCMVSNNRWWGVVGVSDVCVMSNSCSAYLSPCNQQSEALPKVLLLSVDCNILPSVILNWAFHCLSHFDSQLLSVFIISLLSLLPSAHDALKWWAMLVLFHDNVKGARNAKIHPKNWGPVPGLH